MISFFEYLSVPDFVQIALFLLCGAGILAAAFPGRNFGLFHAPDLSKNGRLVVLSLSIIIIVLTVAGMQKILCNPDIKRVESRPFNENSSCTGPWLYKTSLTCDDKTKPIYARVKDGDVCGYDSVTRSVQPPGYKSCRDASHGVERYLNSEVVRQTSGWVSGGKDPVWWCTEMKNRYSAARPGRDIAWRNETRGEQHRKDLLGHVTYNYWCQVTADWNPVYNLKQSPACGPKDRVNQIKQVPKTCYDENNIIGYEEKNNESCGFSARYTVNGYIKSAVLAQQLYESKITPPICSTCSEYTSNSQQRAECLVEIVPIALNSVNGSNSSLLEKIRDAIHTNSGMGQCIDSSAQDRLESFLENASATGTPQ